MVRRVQDRYAGDVGDFLKFGLLRQLCLGSNGASALNLGVVWYLTADEGHNDDGKHVGYLDGSTKAARELAPLDPDLYERLGRVVSEGRSVSNLELADVLPGGSRTFNERLSFADRAGSDRGSWRDQWLAGATTAMAGCDLVFVDPDNGLRRDDHRIPSHRSGSVKHAYHHELRALADGGRRSVVAYHHADRSATVPEQARQRLAEAAAGIGLAPLATVIARRGTPRLFLVLAAPAHQHHLDQRLHSIADGKWGNDLTVAWSEDRTIGSPL